MGRHHFNLNPSHLHASKLASNNVMGPTSRAGFVPVAPTKSNHGIKYSPLMPFAQPSPIYTNPKFESPFRPTTSCLNASPIAIAMAPSVQLSSGLGIEAILSMSLLALQFGLQPSLTRKFTPKNINRSTVVFTQDLVKFCMAAAALLITGGWSKATIGWNYKTWLTVAGIPAILYCIQNFATLIAYQNLSPLTFNVLNQSKTLSAALCCYLLMGKVQSRMQILSLILLFTSACVIEKILPIRFWKKNDVAINGKADDIKNEQSDENDEGKSITDDKKPDNHAQGLIAVLLASFISGLAGKLNAHSHQHSILLIRSVQYTCKIRTSHKMKLVLKEHSHRRIFKVPLVMLLEGGIVIFSQWSYVSYP